MTNNRSRTWQPALMPNLMVGTHPAESNGSTARAAKKLAMIPYTFVLLNWAAVSGLYHYLRGYTGTWESAQ